MTEQQTEPPIPDEPDAVPDAEPDPQPGDDQHTRVGDEEVPQDEPPD